MDGTSSLQVHSSPEKNKSTKEASAYKPRQELAECTHQTAKASLSAPNKTQHDQLRSVKDKPKIFFKSKRTIRYLVRVVQFLVLFLVLTTLVASKMSMITTLAHLRSMTSFGWSNNETTANHRDQQNVKKAIRLYWQLLFILAVPNVITWVRALFNGIIGKSKSQPLPTCWAICGSIMAAAFEAMSETALVFSGWILLPPEIVIFLMNGMLLVPLVINRLSDLVSKRKKDPAADKKEKKKPNENNSTKQKDNQQQANWSRYNIILQVVGLLFQVSGIILTFVFAGLNLHENNASTITRIALAGSALFTFILSATWTDRIQRLLHTPKLTTSQATPPQSSVPLQRSSPLERSSSLPAQSSPLLTSPIAKRRKLSLLSQNSQPCLLSKLMSIDISHEHKIYAESSARWKANFISTTVRLILYPLASYMFFRFTYRLRTKSGVDVTVDPWCLSNNVSINEAFQWEHQEIILFSIHVACGFLVYFFSWIACFMTLHRWGLVVPIFFATPISLVLLIFLTGARPNIGFEIDGMFFGNGISITAANATWLILAFSFSVFLYVGQAFITTYQMWKTKNAILASDEDMYVRPYYSSILLEQYLILNRDVQSKNNEENEENQDGYTVFICSTMFRESFNEMKQMLESLRRVAKFYKSKRNEDSKTNTRFESHIFFDGGCNGDKILPFAVQLLSLIPDTLGVQLKQAKTMQITPYGCRFEWMIETDDGVKNSNGMLFAVHLKDSHKVKNKKRWSQVMYMNYVINYRVKMECAKECVKDFLEQGCQEDCLEKKWRERLSIKLNNTFILTTDADINFKAESAIVLLDMLACDPHVGAVSSRTHPKGNGLLYWYQVFDYAVGHWLQKPAEHILGCVLCCPGCFSVFRCSALKDCLERYSEEVTSASDFLTKDMGEDRWLCTLLIKNGWRLDYCAISKNETFCPVDFDEFFKQRRRWIPSTVANLWELVSSSRKITRNNKSLNYLFIFYQCFIILATAISPATVILIISSSLAQEYGFNQPAVIATLSVVSVMYALVCLYPRTSQKIQLDLAKLLTLLFAILMVAVVVGLLKAIVNDIRILFVTNRTMEVFELPVDATTFYTGFISLVFPITALLHYREFFFLMQSIWYLLGLPGGYLVLLIYSAANLDSRKWGTREEKSDSDNENIVIVLYKNVKKLVLKCAQRGASTQSAIDDKDKQHNMLKDEESKQQQEVKSSDDAAREKSWLYKWLKQNKCSDDCYNQFVNGGYTEQQYVSEMTKSDLEGIGVKPEGRVRQLMKCIKKVNSSPIKSGIPDSVKDWLVDLEMHKEQEDYISIFAAAGYSSSQDVEHLKEVTEEELIRNGVTKQGHRKRLMRAIEMLRAETKDEKQVRKTEKFLKEKKRKNPMKKLEGNECDFWMEKIATTLQPIPERLTGIDDLKKRLTNLRNGAVIGMFFINLIWIMLFLTLTFQELETLNINPQVLIVVFIGVYGVILLIQFITMVIHRFVTLAHYIARLNEKLPVVDNSDEHDEA